MKGYIVLNYRSEPLKWNGQDMFIGCCTVRDKGGEIFFNKGEAEWVAEQERIFWQNAAKDSEVSNPEYAAQCRDHAEVKIWAVEVPEIPGPSVSVRIMKEIAEEQKRTGWGVAVRRIRQAFKTGERLCNIK